MLDPAVCWQVQLCLNFRGQLASASATPDKANERPHEGDRDHEYENGEDDEYTYRIFHRELAVYGVEAIKAVDGCGQREHIILRHLKDVFVRMILGFTRKQVPGRVHFYVAAQNETDRAVLYESGDPVRTRNIRAGVVDKKPGRHQKVTGKQQSGTAVVK